MKTGPIAHIQYPHRLGPNQFTGAPNRRGVEARAHLGWNSIPVERRAIAYTTRYQRIKIALTVLLFQLGAGVFTVPFFLAEDDPCPPGSPGPFFGCEADRNLFTLQVLYWAGGLILMASATAILMAPNRRTRNEQSK